MNNAYVLKGAVCYSEAPDRLCCLPEGYVVCEGGKSLGAYETLPEKYAGFELLDFGGALIIPGLVDLHVHAPQFTFRSLGMDLTLLEWLNTHTFPEEAKYRDLDYAHSAYDAFAGDVRRGPNTRAVVFATTHAPATLLLMDKLEQSGLVSLVGKVNMDRNSHPGVQEQSASQSLADTRAWLASAVERGYKNTAPILTPRFIPSCSDELMEGLGALQKETGLPVQSHLDENPSEVAWVAELCPESKSYADAYRRFGLFGGGAPTIMAHCVWTQPEQIELMRQNGVYVAHCPQSNMNLSSGIAPMRAFLRAGVPAGLGSDVAGGAHTSILRAMGDAIQASKMYWRLVNQDAPALTVAEAFWLGTAGGGSFFGQVGGFAPGYEFDAVVLGDEAAPRGLPVEDRLARAIYLSDDRNIKAKFVRGARLF